MRRFEIVVLLTLAGCGRSCFGGEDPEQSAVRAVPVPVSGLRRVDAPQASPATVPSLNAAGDGARIDVMAVELGRAGEAGSPVEPGRVPKGHRRPRAKLGPT